MSGHAMLGPRSLVREPALLLKHSATISCAVQLTTVQRRAWNSLLAYARPQMDVQELHEIRLKDLADRIAYKSRNYAHLRHEVKALAKTAVEWNVGDRDGSHREAWEVVSTMLSSVAIQRGSGLLRYSYSPMIRALLSHPNLYAKLDLAVQTRIRSRYALPLWEYLTDILGARQASTVRHVPLPQLRRMLGVPPDRWAQYGAFRRDVLLPALQQIQEHTPLVVAIEPISEPANGRPGRRAIIAIAFSVSRRSETAGVAESHRETAAPTVASLTANGVSSGAAVALVEKYDSETIRRNLTLVRDRMKEQKGGAALRNRGAYLRRAIELDYAGNASTGTQVTSTIQGPSVSSLYVSRPPNADEIQSQLAALAPDEVQELNEQFEQWLPVGFIAVYRACGINDPEVEMKWLEFLALAFSKSRA